MRALTSLLQSILKFFPARRAREEMRIPQEELRKALLEMMADPVGRKMLRDTLVTVFPVQGGTCTSPKDVGPGDSFGANCSGGDYSFPGKVGIGLTSPVTALDVAGTVRAIQTANAPYGSYLMPTGGSANGYRFGLGNNVYFDGTNWITKGDSVNNAGAAVLTNNGDGRLSILTVPRTGGSDQTISNASLEDYERVRVTSDGNVGIGTTGPSEKLEVAGNVKISGTGNGIKFPDDSVLTSANGSNNRAAVFDGSTLITRKLLDDGTHVAVVPSGVTANLSTFTVQANASFPATGSVSVSPNIVVVSGTSTQFQNEVAVGDKIQVTISGTTYTRTVVSVDSQTSLTVDTSYPVSMTVSGLTMTVRPSIQKLMDADGNIKFIIDDSGFMALAGATTNDNEKTGYVICKADHTFVDSNQEMRGYQGTMRYTRTTPDTSDASHLGWDVFSYGGAVSLENMGLVDSGLVNTSGTAVTWVSGTKFDWASAGQHIQINGTDYVIASVASNTSLTLTASAGTQSNAAYVAYSGTVNTSGNSVTWVSGTKFDWASAGQKIKIGASYYDIASVPSSTSLTLTTSAGTQTGVPYTDVNIRGQMKPFQSELYFNKMADGAPKYYVHGDALNYVASLTKVEAIPRSGQPDDPTCSLRFWAGYLVGTPCPDHKGAVGQVGTGYGIWVQNLQDEPDPNDQPGQSTLVEANAASIKIEGLDNYGRIQWPTTSIYEVSDHATHRTTEQILELNAPNGVRTAAAVPFSAGGSLSSGGYVNAAASSGFRINGQAPAGHYLRGNDVNYVDSQILPGDLPDASATQGGKVNTGTQTFTGTRTFANDVGVTGNLGVSTNLYVTGQIASSGLVYVANTVDATGFKVAGTAGVDGTFTTADGKTVTVTKGIITSIV